jgi:type II secretion system protein J
MNVMRQRGKQSGDTLAPLVSRPEIRKVLDCASPLALFDGPRASESGRGLAQSKTLARDSRPRSANPKSWDLNSSAFTLLEILIAVAAFAIVLAAINTVFYSALRLRNSTTSAIEKALPMEHALGVIKRDLANLVLPGGAMAGAFTTTSTSNSVAGQSSPNFYTASGMIDETSPFAEVQRVSYLLTASTNQTGGKDLIRSVSRNLLPSLQDQTEQEWLMAGVQTLTFLYLDGTQWKDSWDSTIENTSTGMSNGLPAAVKVQLQMMSENSGSSRSRSRELPIELVVPIVVQQRTNQTQQVAATTGGAQ